MQHKNDYSVIVFLPDSEKPKKWTYVHKLNGFSMFINREFPSWTHFNVYERRTGKFLKRFYPGQFIPPFLCFFFLTFNNVHLQVHTFINGFNNTATIPIL